jgi:diguanylate cyclase (GGDEF)-like protein/PAS domain S-box-containing protein
MRVSDPSSMVDLIDELPDLVCRYLPDSTLVYVNRAYADYYRTTPDRLVGRRFLDLVPPALRPKVEANLVAVQRLTPHQPVLVNEHRSADGEGRIRWQQWTDKGRFDDSGTLVEVVSIGRDVTERRLAEERARFLAAHDPLTGLLNRRSILEGLERALRTARRTRTRLGLLYMDVDGFKAVNDAAGHAAGDELLVAVADRLRDGFRHSDMVGRIGGDEFVVLCPRLVSPAHLDALAERCRRLVETASAGAARVGGVSIGTACSEPDDDADSLLRRADAAMYRDKARRSRRVTTG